MTSLIASTVAYFAASYFIRRYLEASGIPRGPTRGLVVLVLALGIAYGSAAVIDWTLP